MPFSLASPVLFQEFFWNDPRYPDLPVVIEVRRVDVGIDDARKELMQSATWGATNKPDYRLTFELSAEEVWLREVYLTLAACNIMENDETPLFRFENKRLAMTEAEFQLAWGRLPPEYAGTIIDCVHKLNPRWLLEEAI